MGRPAQLPHSRNVGRLDCVQRLFSLLQGWPGRLQLLLGLVPLHLNLLDNLLRLLLVDLDQVLHDLCVLGLLCHLNEDLLGFLVGHQQVLLHLGQLLFEDLHGLGGLLQLLQARVHACAEAANLLLLPGVDLLVAVNEGEEGLGRDMGGAAEAGEVVLTGDGDAVLDGGHGLEEVLLDFRGALDLEGGEEVGGHRNQGILGPRLEPVYGASYTKENI